MFAFIQKQHRQQWNCTVKLIKPRAASPRPFQLKKAMSVQRCTANSTRENFHNFFILFIFSTEVKNENGFGPLEESVWTEKLQIVSHFLDNH